MFQVAPPYVSLFRVYIRRAQDLEILGLDGVTPLNHLAAGPFGPGAQPVLLTTRSILLLEHEVPPR
jgi:hypothetical protein